MYDRQVIRREWRNTEGKLHRTTGPAVEEWIVLPGGGGGHVLSYLSWWHFGKPHREGRSARRMWHIANDGTRVLAWEEWWRHNTRHRVGGPSFRHWPAGPDDTRTLACEYWHVNGKWHRVDGPALNGRRVYCQNREVAREDLPWLRRGLRLLVPLAIAKQQGSGGGSVISPAWTRDARVAPTHATPTASPTYRSAVGGVVLLCV